MLLSDIHRHSLSPRRRTPHPNPIIGPNLRLTSTIIPLPKNSHNPLQILLHLPRDETVPLQGDAHEDEAGRAGEEHGNHRQGAAFWMSNKQTKICHFACHKIGLFPTGVDYILEGRRRADDIYRIGRTSQDLHTPQRRHSITLGVNLRRGCPGGQPAKKGHCICSPKDRLLDHQQKRCRADHGLLDQ